MDKIHRAQGFTLVEMLVSMSMFAVVSLGIVTYIGGSFRKIGLETRTAIATNELKNALNLLSGEFRMGSKMSPYIPGNLPATVRCGSNISVSTNSLRFLVVHDDSTSSNGLRPIYVGYIYDPTTRELKRGEVASSSNTSCAVPASDPTSSSNAYTVATNVVAVDTNGDGTNEPIFSYAGSQLSVNLGVELTSPGGWKNSQSVSTQIHLRRG